MTIVDGIAKGHFFFPFGGQVQKKDAFRRKRPNMIIISHSKIQVNIFTSKINDSAFYTIVTEVICMMSPLAKRLAAWYSDVTKKVIPNTVITPAGWTFLYLPFYINANRDRKLKNMNAAEGIPTKHESPVEPAESEVTQ